MHYLPCCVIQSISMSLMFINMNHPHISCHVIAATQKIQIDGYKMLKTFSLSTMYIVRADLAHRIKKKKIIET